MGYPPDHRPVDVQSDLTEKRTISSVSELISEFCKLYPSKSRIFDKKVMKANGDSIRNFKLELQNELPVIVGFDRQNSPIIANKPVYILKRRTHNSYLSFIGKSQNIYFDFYSLDTVLVLE